MKAFFICFFVGGGAYVLLELLWRGRSHISMFVAGGLAMALLDALFFRYAPPMYARCIMGALLISALEFATGYIVNLRLGLNVWDYSDRPFNLYGQVCLPFSLLWCLITLPISLLSGALRSLL